MTAEKKKITEAGTVMPYIEGNERIITRSIPVYGEADICVGDEAEGVHLIRELAGTKGCALRMSGDCRDEGMHTAFFRRVYTALGSGGSGVSVIVVIPAVVLPSEAEAVRKYAQSAREGLKRENVALGRLHAGIAVESPSAAILADLLSPMADFFVFDGEAVRSSMEDGCGRRMTDAAAHEFTERCLRMTVAAAKREGIAVYQAI